MDFTERAFQAAARHIGASYIWGGKGDITWPKGEPSDFGHVFDCSGLVTWGLLLANGPDWRLTESAETLRLKLPRFQSFGFHLRFYDGDKNGTADHVAFAYGNEAQAMVLEAAGGGRNTLTPTPGAQVRIGSERRGDLIAVRSLSF